MRQGASGCFPFASPINCKTVLFFLFRFYLRTTTVSPLLGLLLDAGSSSNSETTAAGQEEHIRSLVVGTRVHSLLLLLLLLFSSPPFWSAGAAASSARGLLWSLDRPLSLLRHVRHVGVERMEFLPFSSSSRLSHAHSAQLDQPTKLSVIVIGFNLIFATSATKGGPQLPTPPPPSSFCLWRHAMRRASKRASAFHHHRLPSIVGRRVLHHFSHPGPPLPPSTLPARPSVFGASIPPPRAPDGARCHGPLSLPHRALSSSSFM